MIVVIIIYSLIGIASEGEVMLNYLHPHFLNQVVRKYWSRKAMSL